MQVNRPYQTPTLFTNLFSFCSVEENRRNTLFNTTMITVSDIEDSWQVAELELGFDNLKSMQFRILIE